MIPIVLDPGMTKMALVGRGDIAVSRLAWLQQGGAAHVPVFSDDPSADLEAAAGQRLCRHLPGAAELAGFQVVWIADLPVEIA